MMKKLLLFLTFSVSTIIILAQAEGDFESRQSGDWNNSDTWNEFEFPGLWNNTLNIPTEDDNVFIASDHLVTLGATPGDLNLSGNLIVKANADLDMTGYSLSLNGGSIFIESNINGTGELIFDGADVVATVERYISGNKWHQIAFGGNPGELNPAIWNTIKASTVYKDNNPNVWLMDYDRVNSEWNFVEDLDTDLPLWFGYTIKGSSDFTFDYQETMTALDGTASDPGAQANLFAPLTNPYSSSYEVFKGGNSLGTNLYDVIWVWNQTSGSGGAYDYYASAGGGNFSGKVARGQSYFVKAIATTTSTYQYDAASRVFVDGDNFLKEDGLLNWDDDFGKGTYAMFKVVDGASKNSVFVSFGENGTNGIENGYDVFKKFGGETTPQLYLVENEEQLSMNYIETLKEVEERVIVMNLQPGIDGEHIMAANLKSLPETKVTLEDLQTGTMHIFNEEEQYSFNASIEDDPARFLVHFLYSPTGIENTDESASDHVSIYAYNKAIYVSSNQKLTQISTIKVYDLIGREILNKQIEIGNTQKIPVDIINAYVVVKVITDSKVTTTKVFVN